MTEKERFIQRASHDGSSKLKAGIIACWRFNLENEQNNKFIKQLQEN